MSLQIGRGFGDLLCIAEIFQDAKSHRDAGWTAEAWLSMCCIRRERVRDEAANIGPFDYRLAYHWPEVPMVAAFAFRATEPCA